MHVDRKNPKTAAIEKLGEQLRTAMPLSRINSISIYDRSGNVLWLSEGALGPDETDMVVGALSTATKEKDQNSWEFVIEDGRVAIFMPIRAPAKDPVGMVLVLTDIKYDSDTVRTRVLSTTAFELLEELAPLMPSLRDSQKEKNISWTDLSLLEDPIEIPPDGPLVNLTGRRKVAEPPKSMDIPDLEFLTLEEDVPDRTGIFIRPPMPALEEPPTEVALQVLPFIKLHSGGQLRRFEILARGTPQQNRNPAQLDRLAVEQLLAWLDHSREVWTLLPTSFSLSVSLASLENMGFLKHVEASLARNRVSAGTLGFDLTESVCAQYRAKAERFVEECGRLGCFIVIDEFSFDPAVVPLLRHKAVHLLKMQAKITSGILKDKLSQAMVLAIVNAAKVMGVHCAIKKPESPGILRWMKEVGCDLVQADAATQAKPLESLKGAQTGSHPKAATK